MGTEENKESIQKKISHPLSENENMEEDNEKNSINFASAKIGSFHIKQENFIGQLVKGKKEGKGVAFIKMVINMMEILKMIKKKEKVHIFIMKKEKDIKGILKMIIQMELENIILKMEIDMKECLKMEKNMVKEL